MTSIFVESITLRQRLLVIWPQVRSGGSTSDGKPELRQQITYLGAASFYVDGLEKCLESIPRRIGLRAQWLTHNNNNILLEEI